MKAILIKILLTAAAFLVIESVYAQTDADTKAFLNELIGERDIVYENYTRPYTTLKMLESLGLDSSANKSGYYSDNVAELNLTKGEKIYVTAEIKKLKDVVWSNDIFENGKGLDSATMNSIFSRNGGGWEYFHEHNGAKYFSFTKPIFIRNGTLCFFYKGYGCGGLCGQGWFAVYEKKNGSWVRKLELYSWIS